MTSNGEYTNEPRARLCHLRRWPNFVGYGFNLHCEKSKPGQYIGKVDPDSPAESAGLREYDRIIEVNFVPIGNENHKQVVTRIKEGVTRNGIKYPEEVILLVLDPDTDAYYKNKSIVVRSTDPNIDKLETEIRDGTENGDQSPHLTTNKSIGQIDSPIHRKSIESNREYKHVTDFTGPTVTHTTKTNGSPTISRTSDQDYDHENYPEQSSPSKRKELTSVDNASPTKESQLKPANTEVSRTQTSPANGSSEALELKMSAAEYREKLKAQQARKRDPRQDQQLSMKQKHDLIDRL
jgi:Na(+)/H(+) exchange regulatory cofactor NHE-RF2